jgi:hypothetical protein
VPTTAASTYRAVASNFEPDQGSSLSRTARDAIIDVVFGGIENDLIVPTEGVHRVAGLDGFAPADPLVFPASAGVATAASGSRMPSLGRSSSGCSPVFAQRLVDGGLRITRRPH